MKCECEQPGYCERFQRRMVGRLHDICQGKVLTPEQCAAYRASWSGQSESLECVHRGEERRREECQSCGGRVQIKVLACVVHGECQLGSGLPVVKSCSTCSDKIATISV